LDQNEVRRGIDINRDKVLLVVAAVCILIVVASWGLSESTSGVTERASVVSSVGSLGLGAAVGAYVGAREAHRLRQKAEQEQEDRERGGLLRLLYTELSQNEQNIAHISDLLNQPVTAKSALAMRGRYVTAEAWRAVRVDVAKSILGEEIAVLSDYYKNVLPLEEVAAIERARKDRDTDHETSSNVISQAQTLLQALAEREMDAQALIRV
jgi:hypothetical protein